MIIYGTALLAVCLLVGLCIGRSIGWMLGVDGDIGGVGLSMILLILSQDWLHRKGLMAAPSNQGVAYWGAMYVPIVVAMAASQNVMGAVNGGLMALVADC